MSGVLEAVGSFAALVLGALLLTSGEPAGWVAGAALVGFAAYIGLVNAIAAGIRRARSDYEYVEEE